MSRYRYPQLQVAENYSNLYNLNQNMCQSNNLIPISPLNSIVWMLNKKTKDYYSRA